MTLYPQLVFDPKQPNSVEKISSPTKSRIINLPNKIHLDAGQLVIYVKDRPYLKFVHRSTENLQPCHITTIHRPGLHNLNFIPDDGQSDRCLGTLELTPIGSGDD